MHNMESQIHYLEQVAYSAVLRAFKAQSDALTWDKEDLITGLRKELRVSDDEHRELLAKVNVEDIICQIREWRKSGGVHNAMVNVPQPIHDPVLPSQTMSATWKRQKTSLPLSVQPQPLNALGAEGMSPRYPLTRQTPRGVLSNHGSLVISSANEPVDVETLDPLIGRHVMTKWAGDNHFREAVIVDYNPVQGRHALLYDSNTNKESFEWVNLKEVPPGSVRWLGDDPITSHQIVRGGTGRGSTNPVGSAYIPNAGRGRGTSQDLFQKGITPSQNGVAKNDADEIEILHTDSLIKEVEKVLDATHPDLLEIGRAKKILKDHEQALINVIAKLSDASDSGQQRLLYGPSSEIHTTGGRASDSSGLERGEAIANQQEEYIEII